MSHRSELNNSKLVALAIVVTLLLGGCATYERKGMNPARAAQIENEVVSCRFNPTPELEAKILALDPARVTGKDVHEVLSKCPAPRIVNIYGGIHPVELGMFSFVEFLTGMGYPRLSVTNPGDGTCTFSCYENAEMIAGCIAWYYEHEGMRPMIVGHSQGGMQAIKVLYRLAQEPRLQVWNPLTWEPEDRYEITDPITGWKRPVAGLVLPYVSAACAGGAARFLPNQWDINLSLRSIPDTVEEFTGFCKENDFLGGDYLGYGSSNEYEASGTAKVRNVWLPPDYPHSDLPYTKHLADSPETRDWINNYKPGEVHHHPELNTDSRHILWAADVWFSIKKHWVLELQTLVRAHHNQNSDTLPVAGMKTNLPVKHTSMGNTFRNTIVESHAH